MNFKISPNNQGKKYGQYQYWENKMEPIKRKDTWDLVDSP
jgi:hypothetical protein